MALCKTHFFLRFLWVLIRKTGTTFPYSQPVLPDGGVSFTGKEVGLATNGHSTSRSWSGGSGGWQDRFANVEWHNPAGCSFELSDKPSEVRKLQLPQDQQGSYSSLGSCPGVTRSLQSPSLKVLWLLWWRHGFTGAECLREEDGFHLAGQGTSGRAYMFSHHLFCPLVPQLSNPWGEPLLVPIYFWFLQCPSINSHVNTTGWFSCVEPSKVLAREWVWFCAGKRAALAPGCILSRKVAVGREGFGFT